MRSYTFSSKWSMYVDNAQKFCFPVSLQNIWIIRITAAVLLIDIVTKFSTIKVLKGYVFVPTIVDQSVKKTHPAGFENTAIPQFKIKITEIPHENLANTAIPQTPMSPSN